MLYTRDLVLPQPYSNRVTTTSSHPQLRDLLIFTPTSSTLSNEITVATYDSLASHSLYNDSRPTYTPLRFSPCCITTGCGLIAAGGQNSEIALKSVEKDQDWCHQYLPFSSTTSSSSPIGPSGIGGGSIVNSLNISPSPLSPSTPRLLLCSNDEVIKVYEIAGRIPDWEGARRARERVRNEKGFNIVRDEAGDSFTSSTATGQEEGMRDDETDNHREEEEGEEEEEEEEEIEESPNYDPGGPCSLVPRPEFDIKQLSTPINHCSLSSDGKKLVAVGDTDQVFLFDVRSNGEYELVEVIQGGQGCTGVEERIDGIQSTGRGGGRRDASFSTDWERGTDGKSDCFVVASQDGYVSVYDHRQLGGGGRGNGRKSRTVAEFRTTQSGPSGAVRKVKFSPGGRGRIDCGLLAFTEHRNRIHLVDSRTFTSSQILDIPTIDPNQSSTYHSQLGRRVGESVLRVPVGDEGESFPLRNRPLPPPIRRSRTTRRRRRSSVRNQDGQEANPWFDDEFSQELVRERERHDRFRAADRGGRIGGTGGGGDVMEMPDEGRGEVWPTPVDREVERREGGIFETGSGQEVDELEEEEEDQDSDQEEDEEEDSDEDEDEEEEEEGSASSSINTTRPRRFGQPPTTATSSTTQDPRRSYSFIAASAPSNPNNTSARTLDPTTTQTGFRIRQAHPYLPNPSDLDPGGSISLFRAPLLNAAGGRSSTPIGAHPFAQNANQAQPPLNPYSYLAPLAVYYGDVGGTNPTMTSPQYYRPTSASNPMSNNFPHDTSPFDLLGLDWDEFGERLLVATDQRVWEWDVDKRARRGRGVFSFR